MGQRGRWESAPFVCCGAVLSRLSGFLALENQLNLRFADAKLVGDLSNGVLHVAKLNNRNVREIVWLAALAGAFFQRQRLIGFLLQAMPRRRIARLLM